MKSYVSLNIYPDRKRLSEFISEMQKLLEEHGDVFIEDTGDYDYTDYSYEVEYVVDKEKQEALDAVKKEVEELYGIWQKANKAYCDLPRRYVVKESTPTVYHWFENTRPISQSDISEAAKKYGGVFTYVGKRACIAANIPAKTVETVISKEVEKESAVLELARNLAEDNYNAAKRKVEAIASSIARTCERKIK